MIVDDEHQNQKSLGWFKAVLPALITTIPPLIVTAIVSGLGWIFVYELVQKDQVLMNARQAELFKTQNDQLKSIERKLDEGTTYARNRTGLAGDLLNFRESIRPNVSFLVNGFRYTASDHVVISAEIRNMGRIAAYIEDPEITLALYPVPKDLSSEDTIIDKKEYLFQSQFVGLLLPGVSIHQEYDLYVNDPKLSNGEYFFKLMWNVNSDKESMPIISKAFGDEISQDDKNHLTSINYFVFGKLAFRPPALPFIPLPP
jgi:hypothetical protein